MGKNTSQENATLVAPQVSSEYQEQGETRFPRYVVIREGHRVSSHEYETSSDPRALQEKKFWQTVARKHSWGEPVEIVPYDNRLHRVW